MDIDHYRNTERFSINLSNRITNHEKCWSLHDTWPTWVFVSMVCSFFVFLESNLKMKKGKISMDPEQIMLVYDNEFIILFTRYTIYSISSQFHRVFHPDRFLPFLQPKSMTEKVLSIGRKRRVEMPIVACIVDWNDEESHSKEFLKCSLGNFTVDEGMKRGTYWTRGDGNSSNVKSILKIWEYWEWWG